MQRQYSGTAGRIENCQIGVFLAYASPKGRTFLDRELYLPKEWAEDAQRREEAGVPPSTTFQTKLQLARQMLDRAFASGVTVDWVTGDEVYGSDYRFRHWLEERQQCYVLVVRANVYLWDFERGAPRQITVAERIGRLAGKAWQPLSAGDGAKEPRVYNWVCLPVRRSRPSGWGLWLLVRRSLSKPADLAYYFVFGKAGTTLAEMVGVAGMRWTIEETIETATGEVGLDQYEVRRWTSWYRHITLAMLAHAFLTVTRANVGEPPEKGAA